MAEHGIKITPEFQIVNSENEWQNLLEKLKPMRVYDSVQLQLKELCKIRHPERRPTEEEQINWANEKHQDKPAVCYGVWVYYPWNQNLVHVLPEDEFIELRTNRNQYKITPEEQRLLSQKKVGVIGLSVGQSVALTMAMERAFGELRLADFDTLDLSNLNRLRSSLTKLGENKARICAYEILEMDPFLNIVIYEDGIHEENIDSFFNEHGKLDLLIEECDGLDIKILARYKARSYGVPVVMETSDRGLIDLERFDLEPERSLLHGLIGDLDPAKLKNLSMEDKIEFLLPMVGLNALSERMKASMIEVQSSISSWPQLASAVTMGGGVAAEVSRKILLNQSTVSGRFYVDIDEIIPEPELSLSEQIQPEVEHPLTLGEMKAILKQVNPEDVADVLLPDEKVKILEAAIAAPSGGNTQPWRLGFYAGQLCIFHDRYYSQSFLDYANLGSYMAFGAMIENIRVMAASLGYEIKYRYFPDKDENRLVGLCRFQKSSVRTEHIPVQSIFSRMTNRKFSKRNLLGEDLRLELKKLESQVMQAKLTLIEDLHEMNELAEILSTAEMFLLLHPQGHQDMFGKELRMTRKEVIETRDGIDIETLNMSKAEILGLRVASSRKAMEWVERIGGGEAFKKNTKKAIAASGALGIVSMPIYTPEAYCHGGELVQKVWLCCTQLGYSFQPVTQFSYLTARLLHGKGDGFSDKYRDKFIDLNQKFRTIVPETKEREIVFIFRIAKESNMEIRALRREMNKIVVDFI